MFQKHCTIPLIVLCYSVENLFSLVNNYYFLFFQVFTGVGFAICVSCMFQSIVDMSVITWSAQAFYLLFTGQVFTENFFYGQVLDWEDGSGLDNLGTLHGQLSLCLGIACLVIFILIAAGTRSIGKVRFLLKYQFYYHPNDPIQNTG